MTLLSTSIATVTPIIALAMLTAAVRSNNGTENDFNSMTVDGLYEKL